MNSMIPGLNLAPMLATIVYSFIGIVMFLVAYWVLDKLTPFSIKKEIEEDQNTALGSLSVRALLRYPSSSLPRSSVSQDGNRLSTSVLSS